MHYKEGYFIMEHFGTKILKNELVELESVNPDNVQLLIEWTLCPVAQGKFKVVPKMNNEELRELFLMCDERQYFLIKNSDNKPV